MSYVNGTQTASVAASGASVAASALAVSAGNLLVAFVSWVDTPGTITATVTDSAGNTWTPGAKVRESGTTASQMFYAANSAAGASTVVTAAFSAACTFRGIIVEQYDNVLTSNPLDVAATPATGATATATTSSFTTTSSHVRVVSMFTGTAPFSAGSPSTLRHSANYAESQDDVLSAPATAITRSATSSKSGGETWAAHAMAFKLASAEGPVTIARNNTAISYSPYTWKDDGTSANANSTGSYFKFRFSGTSLSMTAVPLGTLPAPAAGDGDNAAAAYPWVRVYIDNLPGVDVNITSGTSSFTLASGLASGTHDCRVVVHKICPTNSPWNLTNAVKIVSFGLDNGATISAPTSLRSKSLLWFGDSISQGVRVNGISPSIYPGGMDSTLTVPALLAELLDAEIGQIGFGGTGFTQAYNGVPAFNTAYSSYSSGVSRLVSGLFSPAPDFVCCMHGTNGTPAQSDVATAIANLRAAAPSAWIFMIVPPGGFRRTEITAATNAAISAGDTKLALIDAGSGSYQTGLNGNNGVVAIGPPNEQSADTIHPYAKTNSRLAAKLSGLMLRAIEPRRFTVALTA